MTFGRGADLGVGSGPGVMVISGAVLSRLDFLVDRREGAVLVWMLGDLVLS